MQYEMYILSSFSILGKLWLTRWRNDQQSSRVVGKALMAVELYDTPARILIFSITRINILLFRIGFLDSNTILACMICIIKSTNIDAKIIKNVKVKSLWVKSTNCSCFPTKHAWCTGIIHELSVICYEIMTKKNSFLVTGGTVAVRNLPVCILHSCHGLR